MSLYIPLISPDPHTALTPTTDLRLCDKHNLLHDITSHVKMLQVTYTLRGQVLIFYTHIKQSSAWKMKEKILG